MEYIAEPRTYVGEAGAQVFDDTVGFCLGQTYHLRYRRRKNSTVAIEVDPASGLRQLIVTTAEFERWWVKA